MPVNLEFDAWLQGKVSVVFDGARGPSFLRTALPRPRPFGPSPHKRLKQGEHGIDALFGRNGVLCVFGAIHANSPHTRRSEPPGINIYEL
jgi:hypothetical protein